MNNRDTLARIIKHHRLDPETGCWEWQRATSVGYGRIKFRGRLDLAHRVAWTMLRGEIPEGLVVDHLCRNQACVNPHHLELVTHAENVRRGVPFRESPEQCKRGHATEWREWSGQRVCHPCSVLLKRRRRLMADMRARTIRIAATEFEAVFGFPIESGDAA